MEAGDHLSAMGRSCTLWIRRSTVHFLSPGLVDAGSRTRVVSSVETGSRSLRVDRAHAWRVFYVSAGPRISESPRRHFRRGTLCRQSLSHHHCLLAKRFRGTAGGSSSAFALVVRSAFGTRWPEGDCAFRVDRSRCLADQHSFGRDGDLFAGTAGDGRCHPATLTQNSVDWRGSALARICVGGFLSFSFGLRTKMGGD